MGNGTLLKNLFLYDRQDIQRIIWLLGIDHYLKPKGCDIAAELLFHSLKRFPGDIKWEDSSEAAQKFKNLDKFRKGIKEDLLIKTSHHRSQASFSGKVPLILSGSDDLDLYYSFGKIDIYYDASYKQEMGWVFQCHAKDTYDFGFDKEIPYKEVFSKGLTQMIGENKGRIANNLGFMSQTDRVITNYDVTIDFEYCYKE